VPSAEKVSDFAGVTAATVNDALMLF